MSWTPLTLVLGFGGQKWSKASSQGELGGCDRVDESCNLLKVQVAGVERGERWLGKRNSNPGDLTVSKGKKLSFKVVRKSCGDLLGLKGFEVFGRRDKVGRSRAAVCQWQQRKDTKSRLNAKHCWCQCNHWESVKIDRRPAPKTEASRKVNNWTRIPRMPFTSRPTPRLGKARHDLKFKSVDPDFGAAVLFDQVNFKVHGFVQQLTFS